MDVFAVISAFWDTLMTYEKNKKCCGRKSTILKPLKSFSLIAIYINLEKDFTDFRSLGTFVQTDRVREPRYAVKTCDLTPLTNIYVK